MHSLRFNHIFFALLLLCAASAFFLPKYVDPARAPFQNIFFPVAKPARSMSEWIRSRFDHHRVPDNGSPTAPRSDQDVRQENDELRQMVSWLSTQLQAEQEKESQRKQLGTLRDYCLPFTVDSGDTGTTESLTISGSMLDHLQKDMAVIFQGGLVGRLDKPGPVGTHLRLITDRGYRVMGQFKRYQKEPDGKLAWVTLSKDQFIARGIGKNQMLIEKLDKSFEKQIQTGDWFVLDDTDWPPHARGVKIGQALSSPGPSRSMPGFDEVLLQPSATLTQLHEVMVIVK